MPDGMEIDEFVEKFFEIEDGSNPNALPRYIKSQPEPKKQGLIKVVVGTTFDTMVQDPEKDVLIQFWAPWCEACKPFALKYRKLASEPPAPELMNLYISHQYPMVHCQ